MPPLPPPMSVSRVAPELYQGSAPLPGTPLRSHAFDVLVLAADEYQPRSKNFPGVLVMHAPLDDDVVRGLRSVERMVYENAAREVASLVRSGRRVLVTCWEGRNRSGLIVAKALQHLGHTPRRSVELVRAARPRALANPRFVEELLGMHRRSRAFWEDPRGPWIPLAAPRRGPWAVR